MESSKADKRFSWIATAIITTIALTIAFLYAWNTVQASEYQSVKDEFDYIDSIYLDSTVSEPVELSELELTKDNFFLVCSELEIKFPEVVYAQSRLESGNFTSQNHRNRNNFLGLYNSKRKQYMSFDHWTGCLEAYRDKVQYRYTRDLDLEDYLSWLVEIGYAEDPEYISKVRGILKTL